MLSESEFSELENYQNFARFNSENSLILKILILTKKEQATRNTPRGLFFFYKSLKMTYSAVAYASMGGQIQTRLRSP